MYVVLIFLLVLFARCQLFYRENGGFRFDRKNSNTNTGKKMNEFENGSFPYPYSGYYTVNCSHMFYVLSPSQDMKKSAPLILWLQGGPGAASTVGMLMENGPYILSNDQTLVKNPTAWNLKANMLWIDQPAGAGFSYVDSPDCYEYYSTQSAETLYEALLQFFEDHPEYKSVDFWITGESYAGKYIPTTVSLIVERSGIPNFKGFIINDGLIDPIHQIKGYADIGYVEALFDDSDAEFAVKFEEMMLDEITSGDWHNCGVNWFKFLDYFGNMTGGVSYYDIRSHEGLDLSPYQEWMDQSSVREMFDIPEDVQYNASSDIVGMNYMSDICMSVSRQVVEILDSISSIDCTFLVGQFDYIINRVQIDRFLKNLEWRYQHQFNKVKKQVWRNSNGELAGYFRRYENLNYVMILDSGHMSPVDQPQNVLELVYSIIGIDLD